MFWLYMIGISQSSDVRDNLRNVFRALECLVCLIVVPIRIVINQGRIETFQLLAIIYFSLLRCQEVSKGNTKQSALLETNFANNV